MGSRPWRSCPRTVAPPRSLLALPDLKMLVMDGREFLEGQLPRPPAGHAGGCALGSARAAHETAERAQARTLAVEGKPKPLDLAELAALAQQSLPATLPAA